VFPVDLGSRAVAAIVCVGLTRLWLTINKRNPVLQIYERLGFVRTAAIVMDIGGGFVMDDFRMEKDVA